MKVTIMIVRASLTRIYKRIRKISIRMKEKTQNFNKTCKITINNSQKNMNTMRGRAMNIIKVLKKRSILNKWKSMISTTDLLFSNYIFIIFKQFN